MINRRARSVANQAPRGFAPGTPLLAMFAPDAARRCGLPSTNL
jgi:hypothetical protein